MTAHIAVLSNPRAGKGRAARASALAVSALRAEGVEVRTYAGDSAAATRRLAKAALAARPLALVIVGGDGTVSSALQELSAGGIPVVIVPAGTGNDFARALGLPRNDPAAAAMLALTGRPKAIDIGEARSGDRVSLFLTVAALGFDAVVSDRTNRLVWPRGRLRYYLALVIELCRLRPTEFQISFDDGPAVAAPGTLVAVGNTLSYGGGMPVCIGAEPDDGVLDVVHVAPLGRLRLIALFPLLLTGRHQRHHAVTRRRVRTVTVSAPGLVIYADGERIGEQSCVVSVRPAALTVMVPESERTIRG